MFPAGRQQPPDSVKHISAGGKGKEVSFIWCAEFKAVMASEFRMGWLPWTISIIIENMAFVGEIRPCETRLYNSSKFLHITMLTVKNLQLKGRLA